MSLGEPELASNRLQSELEAATELILDMAYRANKGHIGSALSVAEMVMVGLEFTRGLGTESINRDRFVLSKGHAATALYAGLSVKGMLDAENIATYCASSTLLGTHPITQVSGIDFATGSLGQGISFAVGAALAARLRDDGSAVTCILSDSELDEGSTWESALIAAHLELGNLTVALDFNQQQAMGFTKDVISLEGVPSAWQKIGWEVIDCDGHNVEALSAAFAAARDSTRPTLLVCHTQAGHGVDFMEGKVEWHYLPMTKDQYESAKGQMVKGARR